MSARTEDPAVTAWRMALAPRARLEPTGKHWWRDFVMSVYSDADASWHALRESGQTAPASATSGSMAAYCQLEDDDYELVNPRPKLRDFLVALSGARRDPYELGRAA